MVKGFLRGMTKRRRVVFWTNVVICPLVCGVSLCYTYSQEKDKIEKGKVH